MAADAPPVQSVWVWSSVLFDAQGQATAIRVQDETEQPAELVAQTRQRLAQARIQPPIKEGAPVSLETGVGLRFVVRSGPDGASARVQEMAVRPLVIKAVRLRLPDDVRAARGWEGQVTVRCTVDIEGQCKDTEVEALPGVPESMRRWGRLSLEAWRFDPQRIDGQPVEGTYSYTFHVRTTERYPENFRQDKFDRIQRQRGSSGFER